MQKAAPPPRERPDKTPRAPLPGAADWLQFDRGLSGLDCALVGLLAASLLRHGQPLAAGGGVLVLIGFAAKCVFELVTAQTVFATGDGYAPVPLAHLMGLAAGLVASLARRGDVTHSSRVCHQTVADAH